MVPESVRVNGTGEGGKKWPTAVYRQSSVMILREWLEV